MTRDGRQGSGAGRIRPFDDAHVTSTSRRSRGACKTVKCRRRGGARRTAGACPGRRVYARRASRCRTGWRRQTLRCPRQPALRSPRALHISVRRGCLRTTRRLSRTALRAYTAARTSKRATRASLTLKTKFSRSRGVSSSYRAARLRRRDPTARSCASRQTYEECPCCCWRNRTALLQPLP